MVQLVRWIYSFGSQIAKSGKDMLSFQQIRKFSPLQTQNICHFFFLMSFRTLILEVFNYFVGFALAQSHEDSALCEHQTLSFNGL